MFGRAVRGHKNNRRAPDIRSARIRVGSGGRATWGVALAAVALLWCNFAQAAEPKVLFLRGWFGVFSTGLDRLAEDLRSKGVKAEVAGHLHWEAAVYEIVRERAAGKTNPIVLVGHSQGANNVIDMARALEAHKVPVALLVTLSPLMQHPIPANVATAVNYYQSPGWGAPIAGDAGFHGKLLNIDVSDDWTITHISIDKSARIHADIAREIATLAKEKPAAPSRSAAARPQ